ncbi:MAG: histidine kinase dimerization/phospho-acceptor domain-containing protein [Desulfobacteraceae bacterium]
MGPLRIDGCRRSWKATNPQRQPFRAYHTHRRPQCNHTERFDAMHRNDAFTSSGKTSYAHKFIDPLTSVRLVTELLRDYPDLDAGQQRRFLDLILTSTDRLINLVDGMAKAPTCTTGAGAS